MSPSTTPGGCRIVVPLLTEPSRKRSLDAETRMRLRQNLHARLRLGPPDLQQPLRVRMRCLFLPVLVRNGQHDENREIRTVRRTRYQYNR